MDDYGIGSAASMALHLFENASRHTGRTSRMVAAVHNDDLIVCRRSAEAVELRRLLKDAGKLTRVVAVEHASDLHSRIAQRPKGRLVFTHDWVHRFFVESVKSAEEDLKRIADGLSSVPLDRKIEQANVMNRQRRSDFPL
jgi:hypothetical protein